MLLFSLHHNHQDNQCNKEELPQINKNINVICHILEITKHKVIKAGILLTLVILSEESHGSFVSRDVGMVPDAHAGKLDTSLMSVFALSEQT